MERTCFRFDLHKHAVNLCERLSRCIPNATTANRDSTLCFSRCLLVSRQFNYRFIDQQLIETAYMILNVLRSIPHYNFEFRSDRLLLSNH